MTKNSNIIVSIDDYNEGNTRLAQRILDIGITPLFYIQTMAQGAKEQITELSRIGVDVGSHTMTHPSDIKRLGIEEQRTEIETSKRQIEQWTGKECKHFAYPRGRYNDDTVELVKNAGYETARTTIILKSAWDDNYRMPATIHVSKQRKEYEGRPWDMLADFYWSHCKRTGETFHIWGHALEMQREGTTEDFLTFLRKITV